LFQDAVSKAKCRVGLHEGDWDLVDAATCEFTRTCVRCGRVSTRVRHSWPQWAYLSPGSCQTERVCTRCGRRETGVDHAWGNFGYDAATDCRTVRACSRCGEREIGPTVHAWEPAGAFNQQSTLVCQRCGTTKLNP
jgi:hypothetical protein